MHISYRSPGDAPRVKDKPSCRGNTILKSIALVQEALSIHIILEQCNYPSSSWLNRFCSLFKMAEPNYIAIAPTELALSTPSASDRLKQTVTSRKTDRLWKCWTGPLRLTLQHPSPPISATFHLPFLPPTHVIITRLLTCCSHSVFVRGVGSQDGSECGRMTNSLRYRSAHKQQTPDSGHLQTGGCNTNFTDCLHQDTFFSICCFLFGFTFQIPHTFILPCVIKHPTCLTPCLTSHLSNPPSHHRFFPTASRSSAPYIAVESSRFGRIRGLP